MTRGRPKSEDPRDQWIRVRCTKSEKAGVEAAARDAGKTVSALVRGLGKRPPVEHCACNPIGDPALWPSGDDCHKVGICRQWALYDRVSE